MGGSSAKKPSRIPNFQGFPPPRTTPSSSSVAGDWQREAFFSFVSSSIDGGNFAQISGLNTQKHRRMTIGRSQCGSMGRWIPEHHQRGTMGFLADATVFSKTLHNIYIFRLKNQHDFVKSPYLIIPLRLSSWYRRNPRWKGRPSIIYMSARQSSHFKTNPYRNIKTPIGSIGLVS